ncbi:MAG TPA: wax ester/triacylglycerol synthase family O-acyltransferase [Usitatibacteraceae bacterium]|nr:wax ester/triacylglycerol synthase family O-acyltransferase [Usitatibacteraceae bacterium]
MKPLSGLDAAFLHLETPETPMHVGSLHLYQVPGRGRAGYFERARRHIGARLHLVPVFTRRLASAPFDVASPVWVEDREVDLDRHVRRIRLRKPGTMAQLEAEVARLHGELLDRGRPLWMFYVIEGLATGEVAWYSKIHHATLDGSAGVQLAAALLDVSATPRKVAKPARRALEESPGAAAVLGAAIAKSAGEFGKLLRALPEVARVAGSGVDAIAALGAAAGERGKGGKDGRRGKSGGTGLPIGPATALNGPIGRERAFATASIPLAQAKAIAKRHGAKLNDVVLALVSGALRRYLASHGGLPRKPLVAAMPVSLRAQGDSVYSTRVTMVLANLATHLADPLARLQAIRTSAGHAKALTVAARSIIPMDFPSLGAPWVIAAIARAYGYAQGVRAFPPLANVIVSNVAGPPAPLYLAGARMLSWWPVSIVEHGLGLNVTVQSYAGSLDFGIVAAKNAVPDVRKLADALYDAHEELKSLRGR